MGDQFVGASVGLQCRLNMVGIQSMVRVVRVVQTMDFKADMLAIAGRETHSIHLGVISSREALDPSSPGFSVLRASDSQTVRL